MVARGQKIVPPKGSTVLGEGDHVFIVLRPELRHLVDKLFSRPPEFVEQDVAVGEFPMPGSAHVADIEEFYGIELDAPSHMTLAELCRTRLPGKDCRAGARIPVGNVELVVHEVTTGGDVELVGLDVSPAAVE